MPESVKQFSQTSKVLTRHAKVQGLEYLKLADDLFSQIAVSGLKLIISQLEPNVYSRCALM